MAIFCLILILMAFFGQISFVRAQGVPGICTGEYESPCGFPVEGNPEELVGNATQHDSCIPEGACPWIQGVDIWWPDQATSSQRPTSLLSVLNGEVVAACHRDGVNNKVIAVKNTYYLAYYLHADDCYVNVGDSVSIGTSLGLMGNTGRSTLTHVHFAIKLNSVGAHGYSLRVNEFLPLLTGWSKISGLDPAPVTFFGSQPGNITIDDLPYAMANEVVFFAPYTPTPEAMVVASTPTTIPDVIQPTAVAPVIPTETPQSGVALPAMSEDTRQMLPYVILGLIALAIIFAQGDNTPAGRNRR